MTGPIPGDVLAGAWSAAQDAADRAGVSIEPAGDLATQTEVVDLLAQVWSTERDVIVPLPLLRALEHAGNWTVAVRREGELVGGGFAYVGVDDGGHPHLHSHIVGFAASERGRGCGYATKLHQRAWALERGIDTVTWTYDPLVRANAGFNLVKLGAVVRTYLPSFYGQMSDGVNAADESDRMLVEWELDSDRVRDALAGRARPVTRRDLLALGAVVVLDEVDEDPRVVARDTTSDIVLAATPNDVLSLRSERPAAAARWRGAMRDVVGAALDGGYVADGLTTDGWYVLRQAVTDPSSTVPQGDP